MASNTAMIPNQASGNTVIVVNQGGGRRQAPPYVKRGTTFKGHHFGHCAFACMGGIGLTLTMASVQLGMLSKLLFLLLPVGIFLIGFSIYLVLKAKREFEALPLDHPDRLTYLGVNIAQLPATAIPPTYQAPAPPQSPPDQEAQKFVSHDYHYPHSPGHTGQGPSAPPPGVYPPPPPPSYEHPPPPQGYTPLQRSPAPYTPPPGFYPPPGKNDEDPPPYSAV